MHRIIFQLFRNQWDFSSLLLGLLGCYWGYCLAPGATGLLRTNACYSCTKKATGKYDQLKVRGHAAVTEERVVEGKDCGKTGL